MRLGIVSTGSGWQAKELKRAAERRGWQVFFLHPKRFFADIPSISIRNDEREVEYNAILVRSIPAGSLEQVVFRIDNLYALQQKEIQVVNSPFTIERTVDKAFASIALAGAGIPTPRTVVTESFSKAMDAFEELGEDVVVKPMFGSNGVGIVRVKSIDEAYRIFKGLQLSKYVFYIQKFIPHMDYDIRVFWACGKVISAMIRRSTNWKTNLFQGAIPEPYRVNAELENLCDRIGILFKADYLGIDFLFSEDGSLYVLEVNGIPGWKGLQSVSDVCIADEVLKCIETKKAL